MQRGGKEQTSGTRRNEKRAEEAAEERMNVAAKQLEDQIGYSCCGYAFVGLLALTER